MSRDYEQLITHTCKCFTAPIIIAKIHHCKPGILPTSFSKPKTIPSTSTPKFAEVDAIYSWPRPCLQVCSCFFCGSPQNHFPFLPFSKLLKRIEMPEFTRSCCHQVYSPNLHFLFLFQLYIKYFTSLTSIRSKSFPFLSYQHLKNLLFNAIDATLVCF